MGKWKGLHADSNSPFRGMGFDALADLKRSRRMAMIDKYPPEIRALVHEYGLMTVKALLDVGVTKPNQIKHVVETVLNEFSPTRGAYSVQGKRSAIPMDDAK